MEGHAAGVTRSRAGFTMVEIIIALIVLAFGALGMAGTTAYVVRQVTLGNVSSKRAAALATTIESIRATDFDSIQSGTGSVGNYAMKWDVTTGSRSKTVLIVMTGPGLAPVSGSLPVMSNSAVDTFTYKVVRP